MKHETASRLIKRTRVKFVQLPCHLGRFTTMVGEHGGAFGEIRSVAIGKNYKVRDLDILVRGERLIAAAGEDLPVLARTVREANDELLRAIRCREFAAS